MYLPLEREKVGGGSQCQVSSYHKGCKKTLSAVKSSSQHKQQQLVQSVVSSQRQRKSGHHEEEKEGVKWARFMQTLGCLLGAVGAIGDSRR